MSIGTGIFLSGALIAVVVLYIGTRDRWNWKKILLWSSGIPVVLAASIYASNYAYDLLSKRPKVEESFWDIPLGASERDVLFIKGIPTQTKADTWRYNFNDGNGNWHSTYQVHFQEGKVWLIGYNSAGTTGYAIPEIQGISVGQSEKQVCDKFGLPSATVSSENGLERLYTIAIIICSLAWRETK